MTNKITLNAQQLFYITDLSDRLDVSAEDMKVCAEWNVVTTQLETNDTEEGWEVHMIIFSNEDSYPGKFFACNLTHTPMDGWGIDFEEGDKDQVIELEEVFPKQVTRYFYEEDLEDLEEDEDPTIDSIPAPYDEVLASNSEINN